MSSGASAFQINLDQPLDKPAFGDFLRQNANYGRSGLIVAPIQGIERLAIAISYGPLTTGRSLVTAANQVLPPHATLKYIKPGGEFDGWNGMVRDFEALNVAWDAKVASIWNGSITVYFIRTNTELEIEAAWSDTIDNIKSKIQSTFSSPPDQIWMSFRDKRLEDGRSLSEYNIQNRSTISVIFSPAVGGGDRPLSFTGIDGKTLVVDCSSEASRWHVVGKGLNLSGTCMNRACDAFGSSVYVPKGFELFALHGTSTPGLIEEPCPA